MNLSQLRTMLWLRWRLTRNQWRRHGALNAAIMIVFAYLALVVAVLGSIAGVAGGFFALSNTRPEDAMVVFDALIIAFLFMWLMGLFTELQQSQMLDLSHFLHLPVALRDVFLLNYAASLFSLSILTFLPAMLGLTLGLTLGRGPHMLLLLPLVIGFFFMITTWTHCLRGWLAALMINKRRRQAVIMGITFGFILIFQLPNFVMNAWIRYREKHPAPVSAPLPPPPPLPKASDHLIQQRIEESQRIEAERRIGEEQRIEAAFDMAHRIVPPLWLPNGAWALSEGHVAPAIWSALGMLGIGAWGFARAYRGTVRFYTGGENVKKLPAKIIQDRPTTHKKTLVERKLPLIPEPAGAMALATLRSMLRAPEVKMALVMNVVVFGIIGSGMFMRNRGAPPFEYRPLLASGAVAVTFLGLTQLLFNHFGYDRTGFRALALLPTPRRQILLGKNLALSVLAFIVFSCFLVLATALAHLRFLDVLAAGLSFVIVFLLMSTLGNLASILVPYRVAAGAKKPTKMKAVTALMVFISHISSMLAILPAFLPPLLGMLIAHFTPLPAPAATLLCATVLATLAALLYWLTLAPLGRLMERRETKILEVVTQEIE